MFNGYNIVLNRLAEWLIPTRLRTAVLLAIVKACYTPFVNLHNDFLLYRKAKQYELAMNYQVCYLESFLNDRFDFINRGIHIEDAKNHPAKFIYQRTEGKPFLIFARSESQPKVIYTRGENLGDYANDFVIFIPIGVLFDEKEIRAMVATKLSGKRYKIETY
jgi:hypothetical protein